MCLHLERISSSLTVCIRSIMLYACWKISDIVVPVTVLVCPCLIQSHDDVWRKKTCPVLSCWQLYSNISEYPVNGYKRICRRNHPRIVGGKKNGNSSIQTPWTSSTSLEKKLSSLLALKSFHFIFTFISVLGCIR